MDEIWRDIKNYEGLYQVSNLGRVKSLNYRHTGREQILKPIKYNNDYLRINLWKNNKMKTHTIHRIVAQTFLDNPNNYPCINHIDENKTNNNITNLEWCTHEYNNNYGTRIQRTVESNSIPIYCLETNKIYKSAKECAKELKLSRENIVNILKGRQKQAKGYTFRYSNQVLYKGVK